MLTRWTQRAHLVVLDLSHQRVEGTLLALVSKGWVSMGLGLKARQHRGPKNHSPVPTPTSTHRQPQGSPPWVPDSSGAPPRVALRSDSSWRGISEKRSSQCSARPTAGHGNLAEPDLPPQLNLQLKFTEGASPGSARRAQLATQRQQQK